MAGFPSRVRTASPALPGDPGSATTRGNSGIAASSSSQICGPGPSSGRTLLAEPQERLHGSQQRGGNALREQRELGSGQEFRRPSHPPGPSRPRRAAPALSWRLSPTRERPKPRNGAGNVLALRNARARTCCKLCDRSHFLQKGCSLMLELYTLSSLINKKRHLTCDTHSSLQARSDVQVLEKYLLL